MTVVPHKHKDCRPALPVPSAAASSANVTLRNLMHRGASGALAVSVAGTALGFVIHVVVARLIGKADYGVYVLMLSWIGVLATVAQAGQDINVVRFLPTYVLRGEWGRARGLRRGIGLLVLGISVVMGLAGCVIVYVSRAHHSSAWGTTFYIGFAMLPILTQLQQSGAMHRAFKRAASSNAYNLIVRPLVLIALLPLLVLVFHRIDAPLAAAASALAALVALAVSAWHLSRAWPSAGTHVRPEYRLGEWMRLGVQLSAFSIIWVVGYRVDVLVLGGLLGAGDVGPYYAATIMAAVSTYALNAVNVALGPMIAERYDANDLPGLRAICRRAAHISFAGALVAWVLIAVLGRWALGLFGRGFESAYVPLLILAAGGTLASIFGPVDAILALTKYQKQISLFVVVGVLVNSLVTIALVPHLGPTGAAIGFAVAIIVWRSMAFWFAVVHLGINPFWNNVHKGRG